MIRNNCYLELKTKMFNKGIGQSELSGTTGIKPATLSKKLSGQNDFTLTEVYRILNALSIPLDKMHEFFPNDYRKEQQQ